MIIPEVLLVASSGEGSITVWDVETGTALTSFKNNASPINGFSLLGQDYIVASQLGKPCLHFWTWHKDQIHQRSFPPEPITSIACTQDGTYCAAGGVSGAIHLWEVSTGRLLRTWAAHYKKINCMAFTDKGTELVTGGEDTLVMAWLLPDILDIEGVNTPQIGGTTVPNLHAWSDHTMPVTAISLGKGISHAFIISSSLDRSIKVRCLGTGALLFSVALPSPLTALLLDPAEHALYAGSSQGGIYEISLVDSSTVHQSAQSMVSSPSLNVPGAGMEHSQYTLFEGHINSVTSLAITKDSTRLISGSEDSTVRIWDLQSKQSIRTFVSPCKGSPISSVVVADMSMYMSKGTRKEGTAMNRTKNVDTINNGGSSYGGKKGPQRMQPLAQFSKYASNSGGSGSIKPWEEGSGVVIIDGSWTGTHSGSICGDMDSSYRIKTNCTHYDVNIQGGHAGRHDGAVEQGDDDLMVHNASKSRHKRNAGGGKGDDDEVDALRKENASLREQAQHAIDAMMMMMPPP